MTRLVQGRRRGMAPFTVTVGRAEARETGVVCPVRPGYLLRFLQQDIAEVARDTLASNQSAYCPHLTLAFAVADVEQGLNQQVVRRRDLLKVAGPWTLSVQDG
jgi:hypothetical protein